MLQQGSVSPSARCPIARRSPPVVGAFGRFSRYTAWRAGNEVIAVVAREEQARKAAERRSLAGAKLLRGLDGGARAALEQDCAWRRYRPGERLFERGSDGREVFFVIEGSVNIVSFSPLGREITFATAEAGDTVGEMAAIDGLPRSASVVALEDSLVAVLPAGTFMAMLERHGEIAVLLLQRLSTMIRKSGERVLELSGVKPTDVTLQSAIGRSACAAPARPIRNPRPRPTPRLTNSMKSPGTIIRCVIPTSFSPRGPYCPSRTVNAVGARRIVANRIAEAALGSRLRARQPPYRQLC